uniref:Uncharacterized protein n=1 Tax=Picea sitchensis TaxID=3332 RepID=A9NW58_PICSI|nr:unknown [Picea sitchensis]
MRTMEASSLAWQLPLPTLKTTSTMPGLNLPRMTPRIRTHNPTIQHRRYVGVRVESKNPNCNSLFPRNGRRL